MAPEMLAVFFRIRSCTCSILYQFQSQYEFVYQYYTGRQIAAISQGADDVEPDKFYLRFRAPRSYVHPYSNGQIIE